MTLWADDDERAHAPEPTSAWSETWEWRLVLDDGSLALIVVLVRRPAEGRMSYLCSLIGRERATVSVIEHDIAAPRSGALELRASGIWADHVCEQPFSHWSLGLEAFGLTFDDPDDAVGRGWGTRTPVGLDVEWEDDAPLSPLDSDRGYLVTGRAHGEILVGAEEHDVTGVGHRLHRWGTGPRMPSWWGIAGRAGEGDRTTGTSVVARAVADDDAGHVVEWTMSADGGDPLDRPLLTSRSVRSTARRL